MPPIGNEHIVGIAYRDRTEEIGKFEVNVGAITAVSIGGFLTQFGTLQTATDDITLGVRASQYWTGDRTVVSNDIPASKYAQRENKLRVKYMDVVTEEIFSVSIPTVDLTICNFVPGGKDAVAFTTAGGGHANLVAWVTAFEAIAKSPRNDANAVQVVGCRFIGANT